MTNLKNNGTYIPLDTPVTGVNAPWYATLQRSLAGGPVLASLQVLHDMQVSLSNTFFISMISYTLYMKYLSNSTISSNYLTGIGLNFEEISDVQSDTTYGWADYRSTQIWVQAYLDYNATGTLDIGAYDVIRNYFQITLLEKLFLDNGSLSTDIKFILDDMENRYKTIDPIELGCLQWSNASISRDLPLYLGALPNISSKWPYPSFLSLNSTLNFLPEIFWFLENSNIQGLDYTVYAQNLIDVEYTYPNKNTATLINIDNLTYFFLQLLAGNYVGVLTRFQLANPNLLGPLAKYIESSIYLPLVTPDGTVHPIDNYSFVLSRWGQKALTDSVAQLRSDLFWAVHAKHLFGYYMSTDTSCEITLQTAGVLIETSISACKNAGWDINNPTTWSNLILWIKAANKYSGCSEYQQISQASQLSATDLNAILYTATPNLFSQMQDIQQYISDYYNCTRSVCRYDEMVLMQWSSSVFTKNLTSYIALFTDASNSFYSWLPQNYMQPFEWCNFSPLPMPVSLSQDLLTYNNFLSPNAVKLFFNSYFAGNLSTTASIFNLPSPDYVTSFYNYFQKIVPGSGLFYTAPYHSWVDGFMHPFLAFLYKTNIFEGGNPLAFPFFTVAGNNTDSHSAPRTVMVSGKKNVKDTRNYYEYYGSRFAIKYGGSLCVFCENALNFTYTTIWPVQHILNCSDGGKFPNGLDSSDSLFAYVDLIKKSVMLEYSSSSDYYGLPVDKFVVNPLDFATELTVPENRNYNQLAWGLNGFYNLSSSYGFPFFMSKPHFYGCDPITKGAIDFYAYTPDNPLSQTVTDSSQDEPYLLINPETGASVKLRFKMMGSIVVYKDYYFNTIAQPTGKHGVYLPYYIIKRYSDWTKSMVDKHFGALIEAHYLKKIFFFLGIIGGAFFLQIGLMIAVFIRRYKRRMHHKRLSLAIRKSIDKKSNYK